MPRVLFLLDICLVVIRIELQIYRFPFGRSRSCSVSAQISTHAVVFVLKTFPHFQKPHLKQQNTSVSLAVNIDDREK
mgnify:CR=1 FL=1